MQLVTCGEIQRLQEVPARADVSRQASGGPRMLMPGGVGTCSVPTLISGPTRGTCNCQGKEGSEAETSDETGLEKHSISQ